MRKYPRLFYPPDWRYSGPRRAGSAGSGGPRHGGAPLREPDYREDRHRDHQEDSVKGACCATTENERREEFFLFCYQRGFGACFAHLFFFNGCMQ